MFNVFYLPKFFLRFLGLKKSPCTSINVEIAPFWNFYKYPFLHVLLNDPPVLADHLVQLELGVADVVSSVERADCQVRPWQTISIF